ncbi:MAG: hypothetical protein JW950_11945 [Deltaproteobacteria bacterium]|nr:hypothetical protein [Deltaproteobacteria bacterium]
MPASITDPAKWFDFLQKHWHRRIALIGTLLFLTPFLILIMNFMKFNPVNGGLTYIIVVLFVILCWLRSNQLPRTAKGKIGFVISISASDEAERIKIKEDFITILYQLLKSGTSGHSFHIITVPEHIASTIVTHDDAQKLRIQCRAHFVIFGRVRLRTINGKEEHVLDFEGMVAHRPVPIDVKEFLSMEFTELYPRRLRIGTENDVFSFEFTSEWMNCVAKYIIGIAAACSGDLDYAEILQNDVLRLMEGRDQAFPVFAKLKQRVPIRLGEVRYERAKRAYGNWLTTRDPADIAAMGNHLNSIPPAYAKEYQPIILKSIHLFLSKRDVNGAISILKNYKNKSEGIWLFNMAFLNAYVGNLRTAIRQYRAAMKLKVDEHAPHDVEEFMRWLLEQEPDKYQFYYCLGFVSWKFRGDLARAISYLENFLSAGDTHDFETERQLANSWIAEIRQTTPEHTDGGMKLDPYKTTPET